MTTSKPILDRRVLYPGQILIREGEQGDCAFFVQSGVLGVFRQVGMEEVLVATLVKNSIVGEMALIANSPRMATVKCLETANVVTLTRTMLDKKLAGIDPLVKGLLDVFIQRLTRLTGDYCTLEHRHQKLSRELALIRGAAASVHEDMDETVTRDLGGSAAAKFSRAKMEFARYFHHRLAKDQAETPMTREQVFREFWPVLEEIDRQF